jgi:hypothetical protein
MASSHFNQQTSELMPCLIRDVEKMEAGKLGSLGSWEA